MAILNVVHSRGLAHRDVKPSNIVFVKRWEVGENPQIMLVDWGSAVLARANRQYENVNCDHSESLALDHTLSARKSMIRPCWSGRQHEQASHRRAEHHRISHAIFLKRNKISGEISFT